MAKAKGNLIGSWAFLIGVILAVVFGFTGTISPTLSIVLVVVGLLVGLLNVADEEAAPFLMSGVVLIIAAALGGLALGVVAFLGDILNALLLIFVPATIIVAVKNVFTIARR